MSAPTAELDREHFVWALAASCQLYRVPFDATLALQQLPPPYTIGTLHQALVALEFKAGVREVDAGGLGSVALPCFAAVRVEGDVGRVSLVLLLSAGAEKVTLFEPGAARPLELEPAAFAARYAGRVLQLSRKEAPVADPDGRERPVFGFRWFIPELLRHRRIWRDVLLASLAIQLIALATPLFTQVVIDKVVVHHTQNTLVVVGVALAIFLVFTAGMTWVRQYLVLHTGNRVDAVLGTRVWEHLLALPPRYFEHRPTGVLIARVHGVETIREFVSGAAVTALLDLPFLGIFLAIMFWYSWELSLLVIAVLGTVVALSLAVVPHIRARLNEQFLVGARNQAFLTEYVSGMETVKSLQMEPQLRNRFGDYLAQYLRAGFDTRQLSNTYNVAANTLEQLLTLAILVAGALLVMRNEGFTIGMLVAFQMFASRMSQPMLRLVGLWQEFQQAAIAVKRLGDVMNAPAEPYSMTPAREAAARGEIEIARLAFRYAENLPYLYRDLSVTLRAGRCVALMGPSGTGKSTLAKLLLGFYLPTEGAIKLDGRDIRHLSVNELRRHFGVVPQETTLFSGTIYDNLALANPLATFEEIVAACKMAEIHDVVEQLPEGYQTRIGEHGAGLSGGQKQRIAIARALLKRPKVLIFDEATSNLDLATAEQFARTINKLKGKVTMLFITHQLPRGLQVDEVVTLGANPKQMTVVEENTQSS